MAWSFPPPAGDVTVSSMAPNWLISTGATPPGTSSTRRAPSSAPPVPDAWTRLNGRRGDRYEKVPGVRRRRRHVARAARDLTNTGSLDFCNDVTYKRHNAGATARGGKADVVSVFFLLHEAPASARQILREGFRLLARQCGTSTPSSRPGGQRCVDGVGRLKFDFRTG